MKFFIRLKPLTKLKHGPDRSKMPWWKVVPVLLKLEWRDKNHKGWVSYRGKRLWLYTKFGGIHFDVWREVDK